MFTDLDATLAALLERILVLSREDDDLRQHLRSLAQTILDSTDEDEAFCEESSTELIPTGENLAESVHEALHSIEAAISQESVAEELTPPAQLPELTLGQPTQPAEPRPPEYSPPKITTSDFGVIEERCRLKAEGARWAMTRRRLIADAANFSTEIDPKDRDIIARAKLIPDCFLWMNHPSGPSPTNPNVYEEVAGCFETLADAVALVRQIQDDKEISQAEFEGALDLLAEAQSALRMSIAEIDGSPDPDQNEVFLWLKTTAAENQIFIQRYMRIDDPADPSQWSDLGARIEAVDARLQEARRKARIRKKLLGKVRHKISLIAAEPENAKGDWTILAATVDELVSDGLPPSNRELRELLVPVIEHLPDFDEVPKGFELALREIDRFMSTCSPPEAPTVSQPTQEVVETAKLLKGRSMILIGGERRPAAYNALKKAFELSELVWVPTREHESLDVFEPHIAKKDVAVVLLAIRWSSHSFGEVSAFCEQYGKPLVRLPGGYNPNQVAAQIMSQCSERLASRISEN